MSTFVGRRVPAATVRVQRQPLRLPLPLVLAWWLVKRVVRLLLWVARSPMALTVLTAMTLTWAVCQMSHPMVAVVLFVAVAAAVFALRLAAPGWFQRWVWLPLRSRWRGWAVYRHRWSAAADFADLNRFRSTNGVQYEPVLLSVRSTPDVDRVRARMLAGQVIEDWGRVCDLSLIHI